MCDLSTVNYNNSEFIKFKNVSKIEPYANGGDILITDDETKLIILHGNKIRIVNINNGDLIDSIESNGENFTTFCVSSTILLAVTSNNVITAWDWNSKTLLHTWRNEQKKLITHLSYDHQFNHVAVSSTGSNMIKIYDLEKKYYTKNLKCSSGLSFTKFVPSASLNLLSASSDGNLIVWNVKTSSPHVNLRSHTSTVVDVVFSNIYLYTLGRDKCINIYKIDNFEYATSILLFEDIECLCVSSHFRINKHPNNNEIVSVFTTAGCLKFWSFLPTSCIKSIDIFPSNQSKSLERNTVKTLLYIKSQNRLLLYSYLGEILYFDLLSNRVIKRLPSNLNNIFQIVAVDDHIAVASDSTELRLIDPLTRDCVQILEGHQDTIICICYADDVLVTGSKDETIRVWKKMVTFEFKCIYIAKGHVGGVTAVCLSKKSKTNRFIVSASDDNTVKMWKLDGLLDDTSNDKVLMTSWSVFGHKKTINAIDVSLNDKLIVTVSSDKLAKLWSNDGTHVATLTGHKRSVNCVSFSVIDKQVATGSSDTTIRLWSLHDFTCIKTLEGSDSGVCSLLFLPNGIQLVAGYSCGLIKLWSVPSNTVSLTLQSHEEKVWTLARSNTCNIISGDSSGSIVYWKDVTLMEKEKLKEEEMSILQKEQILSNHIENNDYEIAIVLAIDVGQTMKLYHLINNLLQLQHGHLMLTRIIQQLSSSQLDNIMQYISKWNRNAKYFIISHIILNIVISTFPQHLIQNIPDINTILPTLIPYTERHKARIDKHFQAVAFLDFMLNCMKPIK